MVQVRYKLDTSGKIAPTKLIIRLGTTDLYVRLSGLGGRSIRSIHDKEGVNVFLGLKIYIFGAYTSPS